MELDFTIRTTDAILE